MIITREMVELHRGPKKALDPLRPISVVFEYEATGRPGLDDPNPLAAAVTSVFLSGAECAFRCTMCDLWTHTLDTPTPKGSLPLQIDYALQPETASGPAITQSPRWIKLYNSSNFFDSRCVPQDDWAAIASRTDIFDRVIVENHPRLVNSTAGEFASMIRGKLEVAMGLETVYQPSIQLLNKQMTLADFERAADHLHRMNIDLRVFILLQPPGMPSANAVDEVSRSLQFATQCGARHASIIATRGGNGMMEKLGAQGLFMAPSAFALERCLDNALSLHRSLVVTADLWGFESLSGLCELCVESRRDRLSTINLSQSTVPRCELNCGCSDE